MKAKTGKLKMKTAEWSSQTRRKLRYWKNKLNASKGGKQSKKPPKKNKEEFSSVLWRRDCNEKWKNKKNGKSPP
eukprot:5936626-Karenia_brevis.AAC.1